MPDYPSAIWSPNRNFDPGPTVKDHIVIHGTAGGNSAEAIAQFFRSRENTTNPVSTQYIVDQQGVVVQTVLERDICYGNGTYDMNKRGIAIEHVKSNTDNSNLLTNAQAEASFNLIKNIRTRHNIPIENIIPHSSVVPTKCPGPFPWDSMRDFLRGVAKPMPPSVHQIKAAEHSWDIFLKNMPQGVARKGTGIYQSWLSALVSGKFYGPPTTHEETSNDWNGNSIIVQQFMHARCEWVNGVPNWYSVLGKV